MGSELSSLLAISEYVPSHAPATQRLLNLLSPAAAQPCTRLEPYNLVWAMPTSQLSKTLRCLDCR